jgi:hypothetical protein
LANGLDNQASGGNPIAVIVVLIVFSGLIGPGVFLILAGTAQWLLVNLPAGVIAALVAVIALYWYGLTVWDSNRGGEDHTRLASIVQSASIGQCISIGPLEDRSQRVKLYNQLSGAGVSPRNREARIETEVGPFTRTQTVLFLDVVLKNEAVKQTFIADFGGYFAADWAQQDCWSY